MNESGFKRDFSGAGAVPDYEPESGAGLRVPLSSGSERYDCFKVRRYGKLHFEKRPSAAYAGDLLTVEALRKEFEIGYGLDHPGIVRYLLYEGGSLFEEYIDGDTLRRMMDNKDKRLNDPSFLKNLCSQLIDALEYIHAHGILHLDLKPENVIVEKIGDKAKIIDFGSARSSAFDATEGFTDSYKAPEQGSGNTEVSTDIYLLGKLMEELAQYAGQTGMWKDFIRQATAKNPSKRFANGREARIALENVQGGNREWKSNTGVKFEGLAHKAGGVWALLWRNAYKIIGIGFLLGIALLILWKPVGKILGNISKDSVSVTHDKRIYESSTLPEFEQAQDLLAGPMAKRDEAEGMRLMMIAAEKGDVNAQCYLGLMYRDGTSVLPRDFEKSLYWIRKAADQGDPMAEEEMGYKYYEGQGVKQDYKEAMRWLKLAASHGKATAYSSIGIMYRDGEGVERDLEKAEQNFIKGAESGNSYSANLLAQLYGYIMHPGDPEKAISWFMKASDMGSHRATEQLARIYSEGDSILGIEPDDVLATKYKVRYEMGLGH